MEQKEQLLGAFSEVHDNLLIAADVAVTRGDPMEDGWGVREVLAHIAAWETEAAARIPQLAAGGTDQEYDIAAFNRAAITAIGPAPLGQVRTALEDAHSRLVTLLDGLAPAAFQPNGVAHEWITMLTRHSRGHARQLSERHVDSTE